MNTQTKETQAAMTADSAIEMLKEGNKRFVEGDMAARDLNAQVVQTSSVGQFPFAVVLSCIDSRVPAEKVFDQGIGDIFSARVAGNVASGDVLGSMEFACKLAGSKLVVILGHTRCGAVKGACSGAELGHLTGLLSKITSAVDDAKAQGHSMDSPIDAEVIKIVSTINVHDTIQDVRNQSVVLNDMEKNGEIKIVGAMYHVEDGHVEWL